MKKFLSLFLLLLTSIACVHMSDDVPVADVYFSDRIAVTGNDRVLLSCEYKGNVTVSTLAIQFSDMEDLSNCQEVKLVYDENSYSVSLNQLDEDKTYYYRYVIYNRLGIHQDNRIKAFNISYGGMDPRVETGVVTVSATEISSVKAKLQGVFKFDIIPYNTDLRWGFQMGTSIDKLDRDIPLDASVIPSPQERTSPWNFACWASGLELGTKYYFRAYFMSGTDKTSLVAGKIESFTTAGNRPELSAQIKEIKPRSVVVEGDVQDAGGQAILEIGFFYAEGSSKPTLSDSKVILDSPSNLSAEISGLRSDTQYAVSLYLRNESGTYIGTPVLFRTSVEDVGLSSLADYVGRDVYVTGRIEAKGGKDCILTDGLTALWVFHGGNESFQVYGVGDVVRIVGKVGVLRHAVYLSDVRNVEKCSGTVFPTSPSPKFYVKEDASALIAACLADESKRIVVEQAESYVSVQKRNEAVNTFHLLFDGHSGTYLQVSDPSSSVLESFTGLDEAEIVKVDYWIRGAGQEELDVIVSAVTFSPAVSEIRLSQLSVDLEKGETVTLSATVIPEETFFKQVQWRSEDESIATVTQEGKVTAVAVGATRIVAHCGGKSAYCAVSVSGPVVPVTQISIQQKNLVLVEGQQATLTAAISPSDASDKTVSWNSLSPTIVSIDSNGVVQGLKEGKSVIEASAGSCMDYGVVVVIKQPTKYLAFATEGSSTLSMTMGDNLTPALYYSYDLTNWTQWDYSAISFSKTSPLYMCGDNKDGIKKSSSICKFVVAGSEFSCTGDIMSLIDKNNDVLTIPSDYCFAGLFRDCDLLIEAPTLPATSLKANCYSTMFDSCRKLRYAPQLPAETMRPNCYWAMFANCTSLVSAPDLPAQYLAGSCYAYMFSNCSSLVAPPVMQATELAEYCCEKMFNGCGSLSSAPSLPAMEMLKSCYDTMFKGCVALSSAPDLPVTVLADYCYANMFEGCTGLTKAPDLLASTLYKLCYQSMFAGCTSLKYIKCLATQYAYGYTWDQLPMWKWVDGVSSTGVFVKSASATFNWERSIYGIPVGWSVSEE